MPLITAADWLHLGKYIKSVKQGIGSKVFWLSWLFTSRNQENHYLRRTSFHIRAFRNDWSLFSISISALSILITCSIIKRRQWTSSDLATWEFKFFYNPPSFVWEMNCLSMRLTQVILFYLIHLFHLFQLCHHGRVWVGEEFVHSVLFTQIPG